jgi:hypothetical protein
MNDQPYLVMFDADRIKDFVFATGRLKEIRGGSQLVRDATDAEKIGPFLGIPPEQVIFAEGGSGLLKAAGEDQADDFCRRLARRYRALTHGATLTAVAEPEAHDFDGAIGRAARRLRLAKEGQRIRQQHAQSPFSQPCESCRIQPATRRYYRTEKQCDLLCDTCRAKRERGDQLRNASHQGTDTRQKETNWFQQFRDSLLPPLDAAWQETILPDDLEELAKLSQPDNYLGFLYADGNGLGDLVQRQHTEEDYRRFSRRVSFSLQAALWLALQQHFPAPRQKQVAPFELIALGGDDVILVTVADQVVPLAITLGQLFQRISAALANVPAKELSLEHALEAGRQPSGTIGSAPADEAFTLSSGIVIAHPGQPIHNLELRARELLRSAKRAYPGQAALDFHVVSSPVLRDLADIRREEYEVDKALLTSRPLTLPQAEKLLHRIRSFKNGGEAAEFPRNKLHALYQALFAGRDAAVFETFFLRSRLGKEQQVMLKDLFNDFGIATARPTDPNTPLPPWGRNAHGDVFTVVGDMVELYEFVRPGSPAMAKSAVLAEEVSHVAVQD